MSRATDRRTPPEPRRRWVAGPRGLSALLSGFSLLLALGCTGTDEETSSGLRLRSGTREVRDATAAGELYPADADNLHGLVERLLTASPGVGLTRTRAILVPHAGYRYSGAVAAASFREVDSGFRRVFIIASNHSRGVDFTGVSLPAATHYAIPGIEVPVSGIVDDLHGEQLFTHVPEAHAKHMIEVELPFLHHLRGRPDGVDFAVVPMILGRLDDDQIAKLAATLDAYGDDETLFVFSLDLSHRHPDAEARRLDRFAVRALMARDWRALATAQTDGNQVLQTMAQLAERRGWEPTMLEYRNSGDVTGDRDSVVGYAAIAFTEPMQLTATAGEALLLYASRAVAEQVRSGTTPTAGDELLAQHPQLRLPRGVFVSINKDGELRGCAGHPLQTKPLHENVRHCVIGAAAHDTRFEPIATAELDQELTVSISILDFPVPLHLQRPEEIDKALTPERDGVILIHGEQQSMFLPRVWLKYPQPREFLSRLCAKQARGEDCWADADSELYRFTAYEVGELGI